MHVGIVDDDDLLIESVRFLLQVEPGVQSVQVFASAEALLETQPWPQLDVLLVDLQLPGCSGVELIAQAKARQPTLNCLAFTGSDQLQTVFAAIEAGACGYLLKGLGFRELLSALHAIQAGGAPMTPSIARQVLLQIQNQAQTTPLLINGELSAREREVLLGLERGQAYKEIATALNLSPHTVNTHVKHIYEKLHARSRQEALRTARQRDWL